MLDFLQFHKNFHLVFHALNWIFMYISLEFRSFLQFFFSWRKNHTTIQNSMLCTAIRFESTVLHWFLTWPLVDLLAKERNFLFKPFPLVSGKLAQEEKCRESDGNASMVDRVLARGGAALSNGLLTSDVPISHCMCWLFPISFPRGAQKHIQIKPGNFPD